MKRGTSDTFIKPVDAAEYLILAILSFPVVSLSQPVLI